MLTTINLKLIKLQEHGYHLICPFLINNRKALFLLDTGASRTVMDLQSAKKFNDLLAIKKNEFLSTGLGTNSMESQSIHLSSLKFGKIVIWNYDMVLLDLNHVNVSYESIGIKHIDGVLGNDLLYDLNAVIDYNARTLKLRN